MKIGERLSIAGKELLKANFGAAAKAVFSAPILPSDYRGNGSFFFGADGTEVYFSYSGLNSSVSAYRNCPPLAAVLGKKARAYTNGKIWVLNNDNKEATTKEAKQLRVLLKKPNPIQSWKQFEAQQYIFQMLFGYCPMLAVKPEGFTKNIDAYALWNIPPYMITIEEDTLPFYQQNTIKKITLNWGGYMINLPVEDVLILRDNVPAFDCVSIPENRIKPLEMPINNIIGAYESRNVLINYRGALGILSSEKDQYGPSPIGSEEKENIQNDFRRYGLRKQQWKIIITSASLKWQQMGMATKDLMLFEEIEDDIQRICDGLDFPYRLLSTEKSASYADVKEFSRILYQDAIIPEAETNYEQLSNFFQLENYSLKLEKDYSGIAVLQKNKKENAEARRILGAAVMAEFQSNLITYNRALELLEEDPRAGFDKYYYELQQEGIFSLNTNENENENEGNSEDGETEAG